MNETVAIPSPLQAAVTIDPPNQEEEPIQYDLFVGAPVTEIRAALASVRNLPVPNDTRFSPDQPVRGMFVGNIKGANTRRGFSGAYVHTYECEVTEVVFEGL
jgi:hypothetical protein